MAETQPVGGGDDLRPRRWRATRNEVVIEHTRDLRPLESERERVAAAVRAYTMSLAGLDKAVLDLGGEEIARLRSRAEAAERALEELRAEAVEVVGPFERLLEIDNRHGGEHWPDDSTSACHPTMRSLRRASAFLSRLRSGEVRK